MTILSFGLILTGVLLNAMAQLWLKAGTNVALGELQLQAAMQQSRPFSEWDSNPTSWAGGLACYVLSVAIWIVAFVEGACQRRVSDALDRIRGQRVSRLVLFRGVSHDPEVDRYCRHCGRRVSGRKVIGHEHGAIPCEYL